MHEEFFDLLEKDHEEVREILEKIEETSVGEVKNREKLFQKLKMEIMPHMEAEEQVFYPSLKENKESREEALESIEEHHVTEIILKELDKLAKDDETWGAKFRVFKELVDHHINEEEENLFEVAREVLEEEQMDEIMESFGKEKEKIKKKLA